MFPLRLKTEPTLRDMPSGTMFAIVIVNQAAIENWANIVPGPCGAQARREHWGRYVTFGYKLNFKSEI